MGKGDDEYTLEVSSELNNAFFSTVISLGPSNRSNTCNGIFGMYLSSPGIVASYPHQPVVDIQPNHLFLFNATPMAPFHIKRDESAPKSRSDNLV